jgi:cell division protein FtsB
VRRLRYTVLLTSVVVLVFLGLELPIGQYVANDSAIAQTTAELTRLKAGNAELAAAISRLHEPAQIAQIAHERYGLIFRGQVAYVVEPETTSTRSSSAPAGSLADNPLPAGDIVPSDAPISAGLIGAPVVPSPAGAPQERPRPQRGGFFSSLLHHLEFWRAAA